MDDILYGTAAKDIQVNEGKVIRQGEPVEVYENNAGAFIVIHGDGRTTSPLPWIAVTQLVHPE